MGILKFFKHIFPDVRSVLCRNSGYPSHVKAGGCEVCHPELFGRPIRRNDLATIGLDDEHQRGVAEYQVKKKDVQ